ncbi:MAG: methyltransferase type 11 [Brevundimonas sp.]|nr:methyltransferase type 11 [Brevundimonas sp.]
MPLRPFILPVLCMAAALAACDGERGVHITSTHTQTDDDGKGVLKVVDALQCPQTLGSLTRKGSATDAGRTCTYIGPKGAEVTLQLVALDGKTPPQVLKGFEDRLSASLPMAVAGLQAPGGDVATVKTDATGDSARVTAPGVDIRAEGEDASVSLPGVRIDASGDQASVRIGGLHIDANDSEGTVDIRGGDGENSDNVSVRARNDTAEVRAVASGDATRASWMLSDNRASTEGWRRVGYEARGPVGGPLVVATIRSRDRNGGRVFEDAKDLVTLNVGE